MKELLVILGVVISGIGATGNGESESPWAHQDGSPGLNAGGKEGNGVQGYVKALEEREKAKSDNDALFREEEPLESTMDSQAETERIADTLHWLQEVAFEPYAAANTSKDLSEKIKRFTNVDRDTTSLRNTAVCLSGQIRSLTIPIVSRNLVETLMESQPDGIDLFLRFQMADSFLSRPEICGGSHPQCQIHHALDPEFVKVLQSFRKYLSKMELTLYDNLQVEITGTKGIGWYDRKKCGLVDHVKVFWNAHMCFQMVKQEEKRRGSPYDWVIHARPDEVFSDVLFPLNKLDVNAMTQHRLGMACYGTIKGSDRAPWLKDRFMIFPRALAPALFDDFVERYGSQRCRSFIEDTVRPLCHHKLTWSECQTGAGLVHESQVNFVSTQGVCSGQVVRPNGHIAFHHGKVSDQEYSQPRSDLSRWCQRSYPNLPIDEIPFYENTTLVLQQFCSAEDLQFSVT